MKKKSKKKSFEINDNAVNREYPRHYFKHLPKSVRKNLSFEEIQKLRKRAR